MTEMIKGALLSRLGIRKVHHTRMYHAGICALGLLLLFVPSPGYYSPRLIRAIWGMGHLGLFCGLALVAIYWLAPRWHGSGWRLAAYVLLGLVVLGGATELLQGLTPEREPSFIDLWLDFWGSLLGIALSPRFHATIARRWRAKVVIFAIPGVLISALPVWMTAADDASSYRQFPLLASFETGLETLRWSGGADFARTDQVSKKGRYSLAVTTRAGDFSGVYIRHFPSNWMDYRTLHLDVFATQPLRLTLRINDLQHEQQRMGYEDRFNRPLDLRAGWNAINVPLDQVALAPRQRLLDLAHVRELGIFATQVTEPQTFYIDNLRLLP